MKRIGLVLCVALGCALTIGCEKILSGSSDSSNNELAGDRTEGVGGSGFVWKPRSESNGRLVVLLPSSFAGKVGNVTIRRGSETVESGVFVGNTNGNRPTFRFSQWGGAYGGDLTVVANLNGGGRATWSIPNGARRVS
jgi:hypothetical protein